MRSDGRIEEGEGRLPQARKRLRELSERSSARIGSASWPGTSFMRIEAVVDVLAVAPARAMMVGAA